jgi:hypothetical protein
MFLPRKGAQGFLADNVKGSHVQWHNYQDQEDKWRVYGKRSSSD